MQFIVRGVRSCVLGATISIASGLALAPQVPAQSCAPSSANATTQVPLHSPPVLFTEQRNPLPTVYNTDTLVSMYTDQSWATVTAYSFSAITAQLDTSGLSPGWHCFNFIGGDISVVAKSLSGPFAGDPCGSNFDPKFGWFNLNPIPPWNGPCEYKSTPDGTGVVPTWGLIAVNVVNSSVSLVDPVPDLVSGGAVVPALQLQALLTKGRVVSGVAADGVTQAVVRIQTNAPNHQFSVKLLNDQGAVSSLPAEDGALGNPGDTNPSQNMLTVSAVAVGSDGEGYAFAVYRAPLDFARPLGSGFKSGSCNSASNSDDQLACRSVSLQVQDITLSGSTPITVPVTITRPPVFLIHGLWGDYSQAWKNFSPLVSGKNSVDHRFYVGRVNYNNPIKPPLTTSDPVYTKVNLHTAAENSLGIQYNTSRVMRQINNSMSDFKNGKNSAGVGVAAVQADIVAHSMGGILARSMPILPLYLSDSNFNQGLIHKLITIDTPHLGSPLAPLLLDSTADCSRETLAGSGDFSFTSVTQQGTNPVSGAVADLKPNSPPLGAIAKAGPHPLPTAFIVGVYTNFASLDCTLCAARYLQSKCGSGDAVANKLTGNNWPLIFGPTGNNANDGLVGQTSQLNGLPVGNGVIFPGYIHTPGLRQLDFTGPSVLDPDLVGTISVPNEVIKLLNTPYTNQSVFQTVNP